MKMDSFLSQLRFYFVAESGNRKVGKIPVTTSPKQTCGDCPLKGECYANNGPLAILWNGITKGIRGYTWNQLVTFVESLPLGQFWRHDQAGDLVRQRNSNRINVTALKQLVDANRGKKGYTYTHAPLNAHNRKAIAYANANGFTVNLSSNNIGQADEYAKLGIGPVVTILPQDAPHIGNRTPEGRVITVCPAQTQENVSCDDCRLCQVVNRKAIVGFLAHGISKNRLSEKVSFAC